jgi:putative membrane-bound dehydrogenase-like protein
MRSITLALLLTAVVSGRAQDIGSAMRPQDFNPYFPYLNYPKLTTPMWVGEAGVDAVVILAIDDMRETARYEKFLRPILKRLKAIDGRAPVSIMTCSIDPNLPELQGWLKEGLSLETHTIDHPCPLLQKGDVATAKSTFDRCVDLLCRVPNNRPVAFRMPCCDSLNTVSPRFFAEIFSGTTASGRYLQIDSSVFNLITPNDPSLPRELVWDTDGRERFRKYLPRDRSFVNYIEDYPYPYLIGGNCWEFPCAMPSDWAAQHWHKPRNPITLRDWKAYLDSVVIKKGVFNLVFHPYDWCSPEQIVELIDYSQATYGKRVKFLTFKEASERLAINVLGGPRWVNKTGRGVDVQVRDLNGDGFVDVVIDAGEKPRRRSWDAAKGEWDSQSVFFPMSPTFAVAGKFTYSRSIRLAGRMAIVAGNPGEQAVFGLPNADKPDRMPFSLPPGARLPADGRDHGLRFVDLDGDGNDDVLFSNETEYGIYLFGDVRSGWNRKIAAGKAGEPGSLPLIARDGANNGFFIHGRSLYWQNENTSHLKDLVDRRSFTDLLAGVDLGSKSAEFSRRSIQAKPGFAVELMAAEPLVEDPIAFAFGPDGKLWVVEMGDYPRGVDGKGRAGGRVKFLESTRGDGRYDKATVFLDNLPFPTGVLPWRKGVLVTCAPDIFLAEDTDGDGKADKREVLFTGFVPGNQQHRVNTLAWGLDNWVYVANGDSGGGIKSMKTGKIVLISGRDLRIRPDSGEIDAQTGMTQFGRCRDDWGNWFGGNNANPMWHYLLPDHYVRRNFHVPPPELRVPIIPAVAPVYPISRTLPRFNDLHTANRFTSACSPTVYRDELYGRHFTDSAFVCEPVHNLVSRVVMSPLGATFNGRRAADEERAEFLASSDNWFRPVFAQTGPDGCLWVADMYRHVIEHPEWIPLDWQRKLDLRAGHDKGRILRVVPVWTKPRAMPRLDRMDDAALVAALDSPNGWQRDMSQMMLLWRRDVIDKKAVASLQFLALKSDRPLARLHALCTLDGLGLLSDEVLSAALGDSHPGVRREAIRLGEGRFATSPRSVEALTHRLNETDAHILLQLCCSLGEWDDPRAGTMLASLLTREGTDFRLRAAALSSINKRNLPHVAGAVADTVRGHPTMTQARTEASLALVRLAILMDDRKSLATLIRRVTSRPASPAVTQGVIAGMLESLDQRKMTLAKWADGDSELQGVADRIRMILDQVRRIIANAKAPAADRSAAIRLLAFESTRSADDATLLIGLLTAIEPEEIQTAAIASLGRLRDPSVPRRLLDVWRGLGPAHRGQILNLLLQTNEGVQAILTAAETKQVPLVEIDAAARQRMLSIKTPALRNRADRLFAGVVNPDRQKVIENYLKVRDMKGDAEDGSVVFGKVCAACHRLAAMGNVVGPDLAPLAEKPLDYLLTAIFDPNRSIEARYVEYAAELANGITLRGVLAAETGNSITMITPDGKSHTVLRTQLESLTSTGRSMMPDGLEANINHQEMADLLAFLRVNRPKPKRKVFAGNNPAVVKASTNGMLELTAPLAEIYGSTLVMERQFENLGYWSSPDDVAAWEIDVARPGRYAVELDYACHATAAGNRYEVILGESRLTGTVASTGTWESYRRLTIGNVSLPTGRVRVIMKPDGPVKSAMIDLRSIRLIPVK